MKKTVTLLLTLAMAFSLCCNVFADSLAMTFDLAYDGAEESDLHTRNDGSREYAIENVTEGSQITVYYTITASADFKAVTQNEIYYDHNFFEPVEGVTTESGFSNYNAAPQTRTDGSSYVFFNCYSGNAFTASTAQRIGSFTLTVKEGASGSSVIRSTSYGAAEEGRDPSSGGDKYTPVSSVTTHNLWVGFGTWNGATFQVTLNADGGLVDSKTDVTYSVDTENGGTLTLPTPTRDGYTFDGWFTQDGQKCGAAYTPTADTTLTAHWTAIPVAPRPIISTHPSDSLETAGDLSTDFEVKATVSEDAVATLSAVSDAAIKAAAAESGVVGIDLSEEGEAVEAARLPAGMIGKIASAVKGSDKGGFALKLTSASLEFDAKALQSLANQAQSGELQINMRDTGTMMLNSTQAGAISGMRVFGGYNVSAQSGSKSISQFNGGNIKISIPFNIPNGYYSDGFSAYYVAPDGKLTKLATVYGNGLINFSVSHFSDYIIAYNEEDIRQSRFIDLVPGEYYQDAVAWAVEKGITTGTSPSTFGPNDGTTRAQVVTFLWRAAGKPTVDYEMNFRDVPSDYYTEAVRWAVSNGITDGIYPDTFSPDAVCTRAQIVTFLWRAAGKPEPKGDAGKFTDLLTGEYYVKPVAWAVEQGITSGKTTTTFAPDATCTRGEVVTFLWRSMK